PPSGSSARFAGAGAWGRISGRTFSVDVGRNTTATHCDYEVGQAALPVAGSRTARVSSPATSVPLTSMRKSLRKSMLVIASRCSLQSNFHVTPSWRDSAGSRPIAMTVRIIVAHYRRSVQPLDTSGVRALDGWRTVDNPGFSVKKIENKMALRVVQNGRSEEHTSEL